MNSSNTNEADDLISLDPATADTREEESEITHRMLIWNSQAEYLRARFGEKLEDANYGWGSRYDGVSAAESTKVYWRDKVYILSSHSLCMTPDQIEHELLKL